MIFWTSCPKDPIFGHQIWYLSSNFYTNMIFPLQLSVACDSTYPLAPIAFTNNLRKPPLPFGRGTPRQHCDDLNAHPVLPFFIRRKTLCPSMDPITFCRHTKKILIFIASIFQDYSKQI